MTETPNAEYSVLGTSEGDVITTSSKTMTLVIQVVNSSASSVTGVELWITDSSNAKKACLIPSQEIAAHDGITDYGKHIVPNGYKIRGLAGTAAVIYVEVSYVNGL